MMEVASIPATPSEHFELNKAFWMQGGNIWKMSSLLEVLGLGLLEKKRPSLLIGKHWELDFLRIGWPCRSAFCGKQLVHSSISYGKT